VLPYRSDIPRAVTMVLIASSWGIDSVGCWTRCRHEQVVWTVWDERMTSVEGQWMPGDPSVGRPLSIVGAASVREDVPVQPTGGADPLQPTRWAGRGIGR